MPLTEMTTPGQGGSGGGGSLKLESGTADITSNAAITLNSISTIKAIVTCITNGSYKTFNVWCSDAFDVSKVLSVTSYQPNSPSFASGSGGNPIVSSISGNQFTISARANAQYGNSCLWYAIGE